MASSPGVCLEAPYIQLDQKVFTGSVIFFIDAGPAIDMVGMAWLVASLVLVVYGSRQKLSISWAWASAISFSRLRPAGARKATMKISGAVALT